MPRCVANQRRGCPLSVPQQPHPSSEKAFILNIDDFADEELKEETFCLMFRNAEFANEFRAAHDAARALNESGAPAAAAGDESKAEAEDEEPILFHGDVDGMYGDAAGAQKERVAALTAKFTEKFGVAPNFIARAPGRVNLIGEHIDYHGYNVLPMAVSQDILVAVAVTDAEDTIRCSNVVEKFEDGEVSADPLAPVEVVDSNPTWFQYFQCGYKAAFEARGGDDTSHVGMSVMVDGTVPPGAGLSSSSALVVASTLATAVANGIRLSKTQVAAAAIHAESYIGTIGGGMDQTISCLAQAGKASEIQFSPLRATPVTLPGDVVFVVAHCLVGAPKAFRPYEGYNCRVVEGKFAAKLVAKKAGFEGWAGIQTVQELQQALNLDSAAEIVDLVATHLNEGAYTVPQMQEAFGVEDLSTLFDGDRRKEGAVTVLEHITDYELAKRLRHVAAEAARVARFAELCAGEQSAESVAELGRLLNDSHTSLDADYACSHPELNALVEAARAAGALGSRLTGAGWGGCTVSMVRADGVEEFLTTLRESFYASRLEDMSELNTKLFATAPGAGISVLLVQ